MLFRSIRDLAQTIIDSRPPFSPRPSIKVEEDPENIPGLTWSNPPASSIYDDPLPRALAPIPPSVLSVNPSINPKTPPVQDKKDQRKHRVVHADKVDINTPAFTINVTKCSAKHSPSPPLPPSPTTGNTPPLPPSDDSQDEHYTPVEAILFSCVIACTISLIVIASKL